MQCVDFSSIQVGELCTLNIMEQSLSGTCGKMSLVPNGGLGRSRMPASTKILFITPLIDH